MIYSHNRSPTREELTGLYELVDTKLRSCDRASERVDACVRARSLQRALVRIFMNGAMCENEKDKLRKNQVCTKVSPTRCRLRSVCTKGLCCYAVLPQAVGIKCHIASHMTRLFLFLTPVWAYFISLSHRVVMLWVAVAMLPRVVFVRVERMRKQHPGTIHLSTQNEPVHGPVRHQRYRSTRHRTTGEGHAQTCGQAWVVAWSVRNTVCVCVQIYVVVRPIRDDFGRTYNAFVEWRTAVAAAVGWGVRTWCKRKLCYDYIGYESASGPWTRLLLPALP